jgi:hypothetical protein
MNTELVSYLQQRVEEATKRLQSINEQIQQLNADRETLMGDIEGYKRTVLAETRGTGVTAVVSARPRPIPRHDDPRSTELESSGASKAEFGRRFIRSRADVGSTPVDILRGFQDAGIEISKAYVYSLIQRFKKQEEIRQRRGKWFPVETAIPSLNGAEKTSESETMGDGQNWRLIPREQ